MLPPLDKRLAYRVPAMLPCTFTFLHEPMAAVRLNYNARFVTEVGSPEQCYVQWKDAIRDLFDQFDCRDHIIGVPFDEPLSVTGQFHVTEKPEDKDLDNLIKAILDSMNPSRRKNWAELRTFLWIDDKKIKRYGTWFSVPSSESKIEIELTPLWGRVDPNLHYIEGFSVAQGGGRYLLNTALNYPFACEVPAGVTQPVGDCRVWVVESTSMGVHTVVADPAQAIFYRELTQLPRISETMAKALLGVPWADVCEGLATGNAQFWATSEVKFGWAARALSMLREKFTDSEKHMFSLARSFDPDVFEKTAVAVSSRVSFPWGTVRESLKSLNLAWNNGLDAVFDDATRYIEEKHALAKRATKKKPKSPTRAKRAFDRSR